jgi:8-oxo-dGTP pyrophosphatase MutT (NUDIX family)
MSGSFAHSYLGRLRALTGPQPLLCPCTRVVLEDAQGRILLQARSEPAGVWGLPGGHIELGESALQAARREILEETGLRVTALVPFGHASEPSRERVVLPNGDACHYHAMLFHCHEFEGQPHPADHNESERLDWFDPAGPLPPMGPHVEATVAAFRRYRAGGGFQLI